MKLKDLLKVIFKGEEIILKGTVSKVSNGKVDDTILITRASTLELNIYESLVNCKILEIQIKNNRMEIRINNERI